MVPKLQVLGRVLEISHLVNGRMETDQDSQSIAGEQREGAARIEHQPSCPQAKPQRRNSTHAVNC